MRIGRTLTVIEAAPLHLAPGGDDVGAVRESLVVESVARDVVPAELEVVG